MKRIVNILLFLLTTAFFSVAVSQALPANPLWIAGGFVLLYLAQWAGLYLIKGQRVRGLLMAITAYACSETVGTSPAVYTQVADCPDEGSGILGFFLVKKGFNLATTIIDGTTYATAKTNKDIIPIKDIEAYWPAATQQTIPGLAGRMERHGRWEYDMPFKHEGVEANLHFWNTVNNNKNFSIAFVTEEYKCFAPLDRDLEPVLCAISAAPAGDQEFGKTRFMQGNVKWKSRDLVQYMDNLTPAIIRADFQV